MEPGQPGLADGIEQEEEQEGVIADQVIVRHLRLSAETGDDQLVRLGQEAHGQGVEHHGQGQAQAVAPVFLFDMEAPRDGLGPHHQGQKDDGRGQAHHAGKALVQRGKQDQPQGQKGGPQGQIPLNGDVLPVAVAVAKARLRKGKGREKAQVTQEEQGFPPI